MTVTVVINGHSVSGTPEELGALLASIGSEPPDGLYYSESKKAFLKISEMNANHAKNALLKIYREWVSQLSSLGDKELVEALSTGPSTNKVFLKLLAHYHANI